MPRLAPPLLAVCLLCLLAGCGEHNGASPPLSAPTVSSEPKNEYEKDREEAKKENEERQEEQEEDRKKQEEEYEEIEQKAEERQQEQQSERELNED